jgi:hypothetical protein
MQESFQQVSRDVLQGVLQEAEHRLNIYKATNGAHVKNYKDM